MSFPSVLFLLIFIHEQISFSLPVEMSAFFVQFRITARDAFILFGGEGVMVFEPRMSPNFDLCRSPGSFCFSDLVPCFGKFVNSNNE